MREQHAFRSMGCEVVVGGASAEERLAVERLFDERDRMFSRFRPESELNSVNAQAGTAVRVSREFADILRLALDAARESEGLVQPTLGAELEAAGYDADFSSLVENAAPTAPVRARPERSIHLYDRTAVFPADVRLDLNGVVKGQTVDDALALLNSEGFVCAGGDLAQRGGLVAALPGGGAVRLVRGALATSGSDRCRWIRGGEVRHHLIDPATGAPSTSPWLQVTVCGGTCVAADIAAKAAFLSGDDGPAWLDARCLPGRFVAHDGTITTNTTWRLNLERTATCT